MVKFASEFDRIIYHIAMDQAGHDAFASCWDGSSIALVKGPFRLEPPFADFVPADAAVVRAHGPLAMAYVVFERSDGFVDVRPLNDARCIEIVENEIDEINKAEAE